MGSLQRHGWPQQSGAHEACRSSFRVTKLLEITANGPDNGNV